MRFAQLFDKRRRSGNAKKYAFLVVAVVHRELLSVARLFDTTDGGAIGIGINKKTLLGCNLGGARRAACRVCSLKKMGFRDATRAGSRKGSAPGFN